MTAVATSRRHGATLAVDEPEDPDVRTLIRQVRAERGWTQEEMARHLGLSRASVANIERGGQDMPSSRLLPLLVEVGLLVNGRHREPALARLALRVEALTRTVRAQDAELVRLRSVVAAVRAAVDVP